MSHWAPHITVATVVEQNSRFLLVHEKDHGQPVFNQPAGHWEQGETLIEAAQRETLEETGWLVNIEHFLGVYVYTSPHNGVTYQRIAFSGKVQEQQHRKLDDGIIEAVWLSLEEVREQQAQHRSPMVIRLIEDYLAGKCYPLSMIQHIAPDD